MLRYLRIAASVFCAVVTVALCVLWVRSYWRCDWMERRSNSELLYLASNSGRLEVGKLTAHTKKDSYVLNEVSIGKTFASGLAGENMDRARHRASLGFGWHHLGITETIYIPLWFPAVVFASLAGLPWLRTSFSLRTLLIGTTLFAVVLGLVCYSVR